MENQVPRQAALQATLEQLDARSLNVFWPSKAARATWQPAAMRATVRCCWGFGVAFAPTELTRLQIEYITLTPLTHSTSRITAHRADRASGRAT